MTRLEYRKASGRLIARLIVCGALCLLAISGPSFHALGFSTVGSASARTVKAPCAAATRAKPLTAVSAFTAVGLPAGRAIGAPSYFQLPAGYTSKHAHGGPTYVYVISGALRITDGARNRVFCTGDFFAEAPGHIHTLQVLQRSQVFVLTLLAPGAIATIPVT